jgi:type I restriction enzyme S subunit
VVPVDQSKVVPNFLAYWIGSDSAQRWLTGVQKGVAYTGINIEDLRELPVKLPSLIEQHEIVRRVETLFALADQIEKRVATAQTVVERLTPATLSKAFRGELVPQDPSDEPASALLERIRSELSAKAAQPKTKEHSKKPAMKQLSTDSVKEAILALPKDTFTFADLRVAAPGEYDALTEIVFELLSEKKAPLKQVFNEKTPAGGYLTVWIFNFARESETEEASTRSA